MVSSLNFFVIYTFVIVFTRAADEYCYSKDGNPYGYFGTKTPYSNVRSAEISTPVDCSVIYIWGLVRHGTRYPSQGEEITTEILKLVRDEIVQNHEIHNRGKLCKDDLENFKNWKYPWEDGLYGKIMPQCLKDMENLAENLKIQLPDFLKSASKEKFAIQSSTKSRCQESAIAFTNRLYGTTSNEVGQNNIQIGHKMLLIQGRKKSYDIDELNKFKKSILMDNALSQISSRLGFAAKLDFDFVQQLYKQCVFEKALNINSKSAFCSAFTPHHMKIMEYCEDLDSYYTLGYGEPKFNDQACPLVLDLDRKLEHFQTKSDPSESGSFYFGHSQTLVSFLTKFNLFHDKEPLTADNYATSGESRLWRISHMSPFAANFIAVMYRCSDEMVVSFYLNERLIKFPSCQSGRCSWKTLKDSEFRKEMLKGCNAAVESDAAKDVQKKEDKEASGNTNKNDKSSPADPAQESNKNDKGDSKADVQKKEDKEASGNTNKNDKSSEADPAEESNKNGKDDSKADVQKKEDKEASGNTNKNDKSSEADPAEESNKNGKDDSKADVQKKEDKEASGNTNKNDKRSPADPAQESNKNDKGDSKVTQKEEVKKIVEEILSQLEKKYGSIATGHPKGLDKDKEDEKKKQLKEIKVIMEEVLKESFKKIESTSPENSSKGRAAGLQSTKFQKTCILVLFTIFGLLGEFI